MSIELTVGFAGNPSGLHMEALDWTQDQILEVLSRNPFRPASPADPVRVTVLKTDVLWGPSAPAPENLGEFALDAPRESTPEKIRDETVSALEAAGLRKSPFQSGIKKMTAFRIRDSSGTMVAGVEVDVTKPPGVRLLLPPGSYEAVVFADGDKKPTVIPFEIGDDAGQALIGRLVEGTYMIAAGNIAVSYGGRGW